MLIAWVGLALGVVESAAADSVFSLKRIPGFGIDPVIGGVAAVHLKLASWRRTTSDGGFVIADRLDSRFRRVTPDGRIVTIAGSFGAQSEFSFQGFFNSEGRDPRRAVLPQPVAAAVDPLGGFLLATGRKVSALATAGTQRMGVAMVGGDLARSGLRYVTSSAGTAELELRRGRSVARATGVAGPGLNLMPLPRVAPGFYTLRLRARAPGGSVDDDRLRVLLGGRLPFRAAEDIVAGQPEFQDARYGRDPAAGPSDAAEFDVGPCRRMARKRVDCLIYPSGGDICGYVFSLRLHRNGLLYEHDYECRRPGGYRRHPSASKGFAISLP